jgi:hypothetical protein
MRASAALVLLTLLVAGCVGGNPGNPNLQPPCSDSSPLRIEVVADKPSYKPGELMNVSLFLNNSGQARTLHYRTWELVLRAFDGRAIRTFQREENPVGGGASLSVPGPGRVTLQPNFRPFRVTQELFQPLAPGLYYLCAVLHADNDQVFSGARPFTAEKPPNTL